MARDCDAYTGDHFEAIDHGYHARIYRDTNGYVQAT